MLIWYLRLTVGSIALLALVAEICGFLRLASTIGLPWWAAVVFVVPIIAIEWGFLIFARRLWARGWLGKLLSPIPVLAWLVAIAVSLVAVHSATYVMLASADRSAAQKGETRTNLKATLAELEAQIASLSKANVPRPLKTVREALEWVALAPSLRRATDDCQRIVQDEHRKPCKEVLSLRKELAASRDYEDLQRRAEALRAQLATIPIEAEQDQMPRSFELLYGGVVKMGGMEGIALLVMLLLILVPALGPFCLDIVSREHGRRGGRPQPRARPCSPKGYQPPNRWRERLLVGKLKPTRPRQLHAPRNHPSKGLPSRRKSKRKRARPPGTAARPSQLKQTCPPATPDTRPAATSLPAHILPAVAQTCRRDCGAGRRLRKGGTGQRNQEG